MTEVFTAPDHHDVLVLVVQIAVLLFSARALGELSQRAGQPAVVGEILAGIVLGPTLLSGFVPGLAEWIIPQTEVQGYLLETVAMLGAIFLLVITGLETDLQLIRRHARTALSVSWGGIVTTFSSGFLLGWFLPEFLLADPARRPLFALFLATAMSISAIPVIAKVLIDMGLMRRDIGQTILAAGMNDDTIGWILLGIVAGLASAGGVSTSGIVVTLGSVVFFFVFSFTVGRWFFRRALAVVQDRAASTDRLLTLVVVLTFAWAAFSQVLHLEPVLGAFVAGILFGQLRRLPEQVHHKLESVALGIFAPIFFASAGLKVNLVNLLDPTLMAIAVLVILVATLGKVVGTYLGARIGGRQDHWTALSYGAGLNARGAMEIIIATIGLQLGILGQDVFSIIVLMAMVTSLMAPFGLRFVFDRITPGEEELRRLRREELAETSLVDQVHRVLLPVRLRPAGAAPDVYTVQTRVLGLLGADQDLSVTLLTVTSEERRAEADAFLEKVESLFVAGEVVHKVAVDSDPGRAILEEAGKDYDLLLLGAAEFEGSSEVVFTPLVDELVKVAPCPTAVVGGARRAIAAETGSGQRRKEAGEVVPGAGAPPPAGDWRPRRMLVPTNGSLAARRAAELAFALASSDSLAEVTILNVVVEEMNPHYREREATLERRLGIGHQIVEELRQMGEALDVRTEADVRLGVDPETVIVDVAKRLHKDLVLVGTDVRPGSERLFLGPRVEQILRLAHCPVIVLNTG